MAIPIDLLDARLGRAAAALASSGLDVLLVTTPANVAYLTGLRTSAGVLVLTADRTTLVVDGRYLAAAAAAVAGRAAIDLQAVAPGGSYEEATAELVTQLAATTVGVEGGHMTVGRLAAIRRGIGAPTAPEWRETDGLIEGLRAIKDPWERQTLREAGGRLSSVAACILPKVSAGRTERQVAWDIDVALRSAGFERPAFETIVAGGPNAARPHHRPTDRRLETGELVLVDFGGQLDGYAVDLSRTVALGDVGPRRRHWLEAVAAAQAAAVAAVAPGRLPSEVDTAARRRLAVEGLADYFVHSTGHGLGLDVHERPTIAARGDAAGPLATDMVFTIEPGVYVPGEGGVRIEDDVLVTATGAERLTF
jgi:Xaa-Pro aminopeptidase